MAPSTDWRLTRDLILEAVPNSSASIFVILDIWSLGAKWDSLLVEKLSLRGNCPYEWSEKSLKCHFYTTQWATQSQPTTFFTSGLTLLRLRGSWWAASFSTVECYARQYSSPVASWSETRRKSLQEHWDASCPLYHSAFGGMRWRIAKLKLLGTIILELNRASLTYRDVTVSRIGSISQCIYVHIFCLFAFYM